MVQNPDDFEVFGLPSDKPQMPEGHIAFRADAIDAADKPEVTTEAQAIYAELAEKDQGDPIFAQKRAAVFATIANTALARKVVVPLSDLEIKMGQKRAADLIMEANAELVKESNKIN